jgi:dihydrofolate reductase
MPKTVYATATTLDGFIADEHHSLEWLFASSFDWDGPMSHTAFMAGVGALAMGRSTYDWITERNAGTGAPWGYDMPAWVFTHRPADPPPQGVDVTFVAGDPAARHAQMLRSAGGKDLWIVGGGDLAGRLALAGLLDELRVSVAPVTVGRGMPLLPHRLRLRLDAVARNEDFACMVYAVGGPLQE